MPPHKSFPAARVQAMSFLPPLPPCRPLACCLLTTARLSAIVGEGSCDLADAIRTTGECVQKKGGRWSIKGKVLERLLDGWRDDLVSHFATLWEASGADQRWTADGLESAVVRTSTRGRLVRANSGYKDAPCAAAAHASGSGAMTGRHFVKDINAFQSLARRKSFEERVQRRRGDVPRDQGAAGSLACAQVSETVDDRVVDGADCWNYYHSCRQGGGGWWAEGRARGGEGGGWGRQGGRRSGRGRPRGRQRGTQGGGRRRDWDWEGEACREGGGSLERRGGRDAGRRT